ncbi:MAG: aldo/keto reductase [Planctomycetaceae bacterium]|jgi:predicted aldo/keto reductase-like oxidoreductase|nr:aldo/keto reductase [Planctomycetaceae bacterium]
MNYRTFGKDKREVSVLGFGCMRLPTASGELDGTVIENEASRMIRRGIDAGINYIDTAKVYHDGCSEAIVGRILQGGYREKVLIATKLPLWEVKSRSDADRIFDEQRRDLKTDKIDVYLLHNIQRAYWSTVQKNSLIEWGAKKKEAGEIDYFGFSFHDSYDFFVDVVDAYDYWDFCQLQYNYVGESIQAGRLGVNYAANRGLSVVVMEPLLGGCLAKPIGKMAELFEWNQHEGNDYKPVDLAFRWIWDQPQISVVLSGMSAYSQLEQNLKIASRKDYGTLTQDELSFIMYLQRVYDQSLPIKCTKCRYCMPCPDGVDIPLNFELYNNHFVMTQMNKSALINKVLYDAMPKKQRAANCVKCGKCEKICPQKLPIRDHMKTIQTTFNS